MLKKHRNFMGPSSDDKSKQPKTLDGNHANPVGPK